MWIKIELRKKSSWCRRGCGCVVASINYFGGFIYLFIIEMFSQLYGFSFFLYFFIYRRARSSTWLQECNQQRAAAKNALPALLESLHLCLFMETHHLKLSQTRDPWFCWQWQSHSQKKDAEFCLNDDKNWAAMIQPSPFGLRFLRMSISLLHSSKMLQRTIHHYVDRWTIPPSSIDHWVSRLFPLFPAFSLFVINWWFCPPES